MREVPGAGGGRSIGGQNGTSATIREVDPVVLQVKYFTEVKRHIARISPIFFPRNGDRQDGELRRSKDHVSHRKSLYVNGL